MDTARAKWESGAMVTPSRATALTGRLARCRALCLLLAVAMAATACGYQLGAGGPDVREQRWRVPVVLNNSSEPFLEGRFTNELIDALLRRGARVVRSGEERRLRVVVADFDTNAISLTNIDQVSEYRLRITTDVVVEDDRRRILWKSRGMVLTDEFEAFDDSQQQEDSRQAAIERALHRFSDDLISRLVVTVPEAKPPSVAQ
jgi:outer membrane lipopolysaccharide assembly protein LptE/RlpB